MYITMKTKSIYLGFVVLSLFLITFISAAPTFVGEKLVFNDGVIEGLQNLTLTGTMSVLDLIVRSGSSITLANMTIENQGTHTSFDTDIIIIESDEPTAFLGVQAFNNSTSTHANFILEAGSADFNSVFNILKNSPLHIFSPNASGILNEGPHGTFVESPSRMSWWQFESLNKDEFGNILNLSNLSLLMTLNDSALHLRQGDFIINGSILLLNGSFIGDGSGLTDISGSSLWTNSSGAATYIEGNVGIGTTNPTSLFTINGGTSYEISNASFIENINVSAQDTKTTGLAFSNDGTKMFTIGQTNDHVYEYNLSTAYDISTFIFVQNFSIQAQDAAPRGLDFNDDGTKMFFPGNIGDSVYEYNLSVAYNISTAVFTQSIRIDTATSEDVPLGLDFSRDGTKMFVEGNDNDAVDEYDLSIAFDISTSVYSQTFSFSAKTATPRGLRFNPDGDKMLIGATDICEILLYELSDPYNVSTAVLSQSLNITDQGCSPTGIDFNSDGSVLFYLTLGGIVNEYSLVGNLLILESGGDFTVDINTFFVDAANNRVGIGTLSPTQTLEVIGNINASGKLLVGDGTEPLPSYSFVNDLNTGVYLNSTGLLTFTSNGLNILQLNSSELTSKSYATITNGFDVDGEVPFIIYGVESNETQSALYITSKGGENVNINVGSSDGQVSIGRAINTGQGTLQVGTNGAVSIGTQTNLGPPSADGNVLILGASTSDGTRTIMTMRSPASSQDFKIGINNLAVDGGSVFLENTGNTEMRLINTAGTAINISGLNTTMGGTLNVVGDVIIHKSLTVGNTIFIESVSDLPTAVGGRIELENNTVYIGSGNAVAETLSLSDSLVFGTETVMESVSIVTTNNITAIDGGGIRFINSQIVYANVGTLFAHEATSGVSRFEKTNIIIFPFGGTVFNWVGDSGATTVMIMDEVFISGTTGNYNLGNISGVTFLGDGIQALLFSSGFMFNNLTGTSITSLDMVGDNTGATFLTFGGTTQGQIGISKYGATLQSNEYAVNFVNTTTYSGVSYSFNAPSIFTNRVFEPGSFDQTALGFKFIGNVFTPDSTVKSKLFFNDASNVTTITTVGVFEKLIGTWESEIVERFTQTSDGNMTYIGTEDVSVLAIARNDIQSGVNLQEVTIKFYKNDISLNASAGSIVASNTRPSSVYSQDLIDLTQGDVLNLRVANQDGTSDITLFSSNIILSKV